MDNRINEALIDFALSIIKGAKVTVIYIIPSLLAALMVSPELRDYITKKPELAALWPMINIVGAIIGSYIKRNTSEESKLHKIL